MKKGKTSTCFLITGSNMGNRLRYLGLANYLIEQEIGTIKKKSLIYESEPWGVEAEVSFLNQVLEVSTIMSPLRVMETALEIEQKIGRKRVPGQASRVIDIDLLFFENEILDQPQLVLPHPRLHKRNFVLKPLAEIAPNFVHPVFEKTVSILLKQCTDKLDAFPFEEDFE